jgi:SAM-dependent methyltransferase
MCEYAKTFPFPSEKETLAGWAHMVRRNREQVERFREEPEGADFYAPTASRFKAPTISTEDAVIHIIRGMLKPDDTLLDIGAGGGRYALPLAKRLREVIAVEPSERMRSVLMEGMREYGIQNIRILDARWPLNTALKADVVFISHVGYDIEDIGLFLNAMEVSARRLCVAVFRDGSPAASSYSFWPAIHGEKRVPLPSLKEFLTLQMSRQCLFEIRLIPQEQPDFASRDMLVSFLRQQLFIKPDGEKDRKLMGLIEKVVEVKNGRFSLPSNPGLVGIVSWATH